MIQDALIWTVGGVGVLAVAAGCVGAVHWWSTVRDETDVEDPDEDAEAEPTDPSPAGGMPPILVDPSSHERMRAHLARADWSDPQGSWGPPESDLVDVEPDAESDPADEPDLAAVNPLAYGDLEQVVAALDADVHEVDDLYVQGHLPFGGDLPRRVDPDPDFRSPYDRFVDPTAHIAVGHASVPVKPGRAAGTGDHVPVPTGDVEVVPGNLASPGGPGTTEDLDTVEDFDARPPRVPLGGWAQAAQLAEPRLPRRVRGQAWDDLVARQVSMTDPQLPPRRSDQITATVAADFKSRLIAADLTSGRAQQVPAVLATPTPGTDEIPEPAPWSGPDSNEHTGLTGQIARLTFHADGTVTDPDGNLVGLPPAADVEDRHRAEPDEQDDTEPADEQPETAEPEPALVPANRAERRAAARGVDRAAAAQRAAAQRNLRGRSR